jgi:cobalt-zinc-cadmium efflux system outer membrane protein
MTHPEKLVILRLPARRGNAVVLIGVLLAATFTPGCSAPWMETRGPEQVTQPAQPRAYLAAPTPASAPAPGPENAPIQRTAYQEKKEAAPQPKPQITLPMAIAMCVNNNFRVLAAGQQIQMAEGDLITSSLIPNPILFSDCQLIPLRNVNITNQLGPPQWDALVTFPIDWLLFGKRVAAMQAARLGVEVSRADFADMLRTQLAQTVDGFYEVLMDDAYFKLAEKNLEELKDVEKLTVALANKKQVGKLELDRIKLAVHEALLERHDRELALELAKAKLRPFLGRTAADPDYEVKGTLTVTAVVPPPKLAEVVTLAEANRPDLISDRKAIDQAHAAWVLERRKAKPIVSIQPGWSYQDQANQSISHNGSMFDIGIFTTLPITDRNQGNIHKAQAQIIQRQFTYHGDRADALAEVEAARATYDDAVEHLTQFNTSETLKAAYELRRNMDAAYRAGTRKLIELLDAHKAYQSRLAHIIEFESTYWRALNQLNATVGLNAYDPERGATQPVTRPTAK